MKPNFKCYFSLTLLRNRIFLVNALEGRTKLHMYKGASLNYVGKILPIFDPPPLPHLRRQVLVYYISLCSSIGIWLTPPLPLACLRSLRMPPKQG